MHCLPYVAVTICMSGLQLADISSRMALEANLFGDNVTDAEMFRLGVLVSYLKHSLRQTPSGFDLVPVPMERLADELHSAGSNMDITRKELLSGMIEIFLTPEEAQYFSMSPKGKHSHAKVTLKPQALIPSPSRKMRALLPYVDWDPVPSLETVMTDSRDDEQLHDIGAPDSPPLKTTPSAPHSQFNPQPRQVGSSCSTTAGTAGCKLITQALRPCITLVGAKLDYAR